MLASHFAARAETPPHTLIPEARQSIPHTPMSAASTISTPAPTLLTPSGRSTVSSLLPKALTLFPTVLEPSLAFRVLIMTRVS